MHALRRPPLRSVRALHRFKCHLHAHTYVSVTTGPSTSPCALSSAHTMLHVFVYSLLVVPTSRCTIYVLCTACVCALSRVPLSLAIRAEQAQKSHQSPATGAGTVYCTLYVRCSRTAVRLSTHELEQACGTAPGTAVSLAFVA